jgi:hypothetical protein
MPAINLPNGQSAILYSRDEISERTNRNISRAYLKAAGTASKLNSLGFDDKDSSTWGLFADLSDEDRDSLDGYQGALIVGLVKSWSLGDLPTADSALDLPKPIFEALAEACLIEFNGSTDFSPDTDPKAPTAD